MLHLRFLKLDRERTRQRKRKNILFKYFISSHISSFNKYVYYLTAWLHKMKKKNTKEEKTNFNLIKNQLDMNADIMKTLKVHQSAKATFMLRGCVICPIDPHYNLEVHSYG